MICQHMMVVRTYCRTGMTWSAFCIWNASMSMKYSHVDAVCRCSCSKGFYFLHFAYCVILWHHSSACSSQRCLCIWVKIWTIIVTAIEIRTLTVLILWMNEVCACVFEKCFIISHIQQPQKLSVICKKTLPGLNR